MAKAKKVTPRTYWAIKDELTGEIMPVLFGNKPWSGPKEKAVEVMIVEVTIKEVRCKRGT